MLRKPGVGSGVLGHWLLSRVISDSTRAVIESTRINRVRSLQYGPRLVKDRRGGTTGTLEDEVGVYHHDCLKTACFREKRNGMANLRGIFLK